MENTTGRHFTSDNNSGVLPEILEALPSLNQGHMHAYGGEKLTQAAIKELKRLFGKDIRAYFVFNGTAANVCALSAMTERFHSVICTEHSHLHQDECGAPENIAGVKLLTCPSEDAKLKVSDIKKHLIRLGDQHCSQPKVVSITQPTELGTVYSPSEIKEICDFAHSHGLHVHMDGSRLVNASTSLNLSLKEITADLGVDVVCLGGTKNGLMLGEAVIFFNKTLSENFKYIRKQNLQLAGKMRFISGQFLIWLQKDLYKKYSEHSLQMAQHLRDRLTEIPEVQITQKVESNAVFAILPKKIVKDLRKQFFFYVWNESSFECRLMTSFDTQKEEIDQFCEHIKTLLKKT